jgi:hypothetical protein
MRERLNQLAALHREWGSFISGEASLFDEYAVLRFPGSGR